MPSERRLTVSVGSRVFMPESNHVTKFVNDYAAFVTVFADGDRLGLLLAAATNVRTAAGSLKE